MKSFAELIDNLGVTEVAKIIGTTEGHIRVMKTRNSIPSLYWHKIVKAAKRRKIPVTEDILYDMRQRRFHGAAAACD